MRTVTFVALIALAILTIAAQARAGAPCCCAVPCAAPGPVVQLYRPYDVPPIYIVNQGPVYSGGWVFSRPQVVVPHAIQEYPYVAQDYPYYDGPAMYSRRHWRGPVRARY